MTQRNIQNDFSDVQQSPLNAEISPLQLPIRGEKRIIPALTDVTSIQDNLDQNLAANGLDPSGQPAAIDTDSFIIKAALRPFIDYVVVRIPHRGMTNGTADPTQSGVFRFLINPATVQVSHTTLDGQSMTRAGWQFGVWGEDVIMVTLTGQTAGQYFALGTTDLFQEFTQSYRNLKQLEMVYENNGYWFEGEEAGEGPLASDFTRRRIKMHQDIELACGNFIWSGMFDSLTVSQDAEKPFLSNFTITFMAWKERFRTSSPYIDSIHNNVQRGHSYGVYESYGQTQQQQQIQASPSSVPVPAPEFTSPAVAADQLSQGFVTTDTSALDQTPMFDTFNPGSPLSVFSRGF